MKSLPSLKAVGGGTLRRMGWGLADQAVSSASNFALGILVARAVSVAEFGAFSITFATYTLSLGVSRALSSEPLAVRYSHVEPEAWRTATERATGTALVVGLVFGAACLAAGLALTGALRTSLTLLGLALPGLILQDSWRFAFFAAGQGRRALANDLVWTVVLAAAFLFLLSRGQGSLSWLMAVWGGAGTIAGLFGLYQSAVIPRPQQVAAWWREHRDLAPRYVGEFAMSAGGLQLSLYGVGAVAGLAALGAIRAAYLLLGPLHVLLLGIQLVAVPEGVRVLTRGPQRLRAASAILSIVQVLVVIAWGAVLYLLPIRLGTAMMGSNWEAARTVLLPVTLSVTALAALAGALYGLRSLGSSTRSFRARLITAPVELVATVGGAGVLGAPGAAWGNAAANWFAVGVWWRMFTGATGETDQFDRPDWKPLGFPGDALTGG